MTKIDKDGLTMMSQIVIDVKQFAIAASCTYISSTFTLIHVISLPQINK